MKLAKRMTAALMLGVLACSPSPENEIGLQLYSVRDLLGPYVSEGDCSIFESIAAMGYDYVEAYGYEDGLFLGKEPETFRRDLNAAGLDLVASHCVLSFDLDAWDKAIEAYKRAGMDYVILAWIEAPRSAAEWKAYAELFNTVGRKCRDAGLSFGYHNHGFEFVRIDGMLPYEYLLENTDPELVFFELDTYWAVHEGSQPEEWFSRYPGRFRFLHYKDDSWVGKSGKIDFESISRNPASGAQYRVVEVEWYDGEPVLDVVEKSLKALRN